MNSYEKRVVERVKTRHGELQLSEIQAEDARHYELIFNGVYLMATYNAPSCRVMVDAMLEDLTSRRSLDVLIGGLGMGFALHQALSYPQAHRVCVVELEAKVVSWNRTHLGNADILDDARTEVVVGDFYDYVQGSPRNYHGIVMDIDNGPDWIVRPENRRSYSLSMLKVLGNRLRPGGVLAIWAHARSKSYERALQEVFTEVSTRDALDHDLNGRPLESVIYLARI